MSSESEERAYEEKSQMLLSMLAAGVSLEQILDRAYQLFGHLIVLEDNAYKLLYCTTDEALDPAYASELASQDSEIYHMEFLREVEENQPLLYSTAAEPVFFTLEGFSRLRNGIGARVIIGHESVATISIFEYKHAFSDNDYRLSTLLAGIVSLKMQTDKKRRSGRNSSNEKAKAAGLMQDILQRRITDPHLIEDRARNDQLSDAGAFYVLVLVADDDVPVTLELPYIMRKLEQRTGETGLVIFNDNIVMLLARMMDHLIREGDLDYLNGFLCEVHLHGGLSSRFSSMGDFHRNFLHAARSLEIGRQLELPGFIHRFEDLVIYHIFDSCVALEDLAAYMHSSFRKMIEYDTKHKTNYGNTLSAYLDNRQNKSKTAKLLGLSRTTLIQRIGRIVDLFELDLSDESTVFSLRLSSRIQKYTNRSGSSEDCV